MANVGNPFMNSCILVSVGVVAILINLGIMVNYGRRRIFLTWGLIICAFCQLVVAVVYQANPGPPTTGKVVVAVSVIYVFVYNGAICPFSWLSGGEIPSQRLRSYTFGLAAAIGFLGAWVTTFTAPYFINPSALNWGYVCFHSHLALC
jgi:SP family sugar:H+ symporter-like MFS transporter